MTADTKRVRKLAREARLRAALRDNLKRRKAQIRRRARGPDAAVDAKPADPAPDHTAKTE